MLLAVLMAALSTTGGACSTLAFDEEASPLFRLCAGVPIGMSVLALAGFLLGWALGFGSVTLVLATMAALAPAAVLARRAARNKVASDVSASVRSVVEFVRRPTVRTSAYALAYAAILAVLFLVFRRAIYFKDGAMYTGILNNWGDLPFHLADICRFAFGGNIPPEDPTFAGANFTYPFMSDLVAAMFVKAGARLDYAIVLQDIILAFALVGLFAEFSFQLTKRHGAALLSTLLILLNGGLGWTMLAGDVQNNEKGLVDVLLHLSHDYTVITDTTWRWGNSVTSLLVTQRSILMGMPLAMVLLIELWKAVSLWAKERANGEAAGEPAIARKKKQAPAGENSRPRQYKRMIGAGMVAGLLPLVHVHSFIVAMTVAGCLCLIFRSWGEWAAFFAVVIVLALPQVGWLYLEAPTHYKGFFAFEVGWDHWHDNILWFWFKNTGLFIPLLILALVWRIKKPRKASAAGATPPGVLQTVKCEQCQGENETSSVTCRVCGAPLNVNYLVSGAAGRKGAKVRGPAGFEKPAPSSSRVQSKPDRLLSKTQLLYYVPFAVCFVAPNLFKFAPWIWDNIKILIYWYIASCPLVALLLLRLWRGNALIKAGTVVVFISMVLAGSLDIFRVASGYSEFLELDSSQLGIGRLIEKDTAPGALILHAAVHNNPVAITGRRTLLGYPGHVWSHGIDLGHRQDDIKQIYAGGPAANSLIAEYGIDYALVGRQERDEMKVNDAFFKQFRLVGGAGEIRLYKLR
jgi:hypothetical protein